MALGLLEELGDARPLPPAFWEALATAAPHPQTGHVITMHEDRSVAGTAVVLEVHPPTITL